jgi:hypothetical protein
MIHERCSCGASIKTDEAQAVKLVREWRKSHTCQEGPDEETPISGSAETQIALGFQAGEMPAKEYDPWGDD